MRVEVILDRSQRTQKYSSADFIAHAGIPTRIDAQHKIAHNKVMVIDGAGGRGAGGHHHLGAEGGAMRCDACDGSGVHA